VQQLGDIAAVENVLARQPRPGRDACGDRVHRLWAEVWSLWVNDPKPREPANEFTNAGSGRATAPALLLLQRCFDSARSAPGRAAVAASVGVPPATPTVPTHPRFAPLPSSTDYGYEMRLGPFVRWRS
jgi:hypothetical protein